ncbi:UDP-glucose 4-epimerase family protein [Aeromonas veronii]|uniref:UDP-glucose 4-epimerase family protein n=1 Tax=Aeromonas veronii TaxID=654 RepID=UPI001302C2BE|nr:SDR family oxidoreductase [Aeromonas veronii]KAE9636503.1 NAD-dependent epimerase/dehydratase family protein [Aeromonas veronii]MCF7745147.1 SDR family oxidoreductase [Aeromonas veronii]
MKNKVILTGASGFVGRHIKNTMPREKLILVGRRNLDEEYTFFSSDLDENSQYDSIMKDVSCIIHCAARAHVMNEGNDNPYCLYHKINVDGTLNLARQAAVNGVKRFIYISSIKVNGESTRVNSPFTEKNIPAPEDAYGISKLAAETGLRELSIETNMEVVIIRPPLVYGPGVKANFSAMMNLASKNLPLPLGAINNKRSMVALDNLVDLIVTCIDHPKAANKTFLVSDDHDVSTTELLEMMVRAIGKTPRLLPVPMEWLKFAGKLIGKQAVIERLCGNLQVDISYTKEILGWQPPISMEEGIKRCFTEEQLC